MVRDICVYRSSNSHSSLIQSLNLSNSRTHPKVTTVFRYVRYQSDHILRSDERWLGGID